MHFSLLSFLIALLFTFVFNVEANPVDLTDASSLNTTAALVPPGCVPGWCTNCPLPPNRCTFISRRHGKLVDLYAYHWSCKQAGSGINVPTNLISYDLHTDLLHGTLQVGFLGGGPTLHYNGQFFSKPSCGPSFNMVQCLQEFTCI